ncbi:MAG TPA: alginate lyase family protein [Pyrinomonadaceae bacterium]|nr:alginate lyase family protein [Pyrinomonadaceae bacterium]
MPTTGKKLKKLRRLSLDEVKVRTSQKLSALLERQGWSSLTRVPEDPEFLARLDPTKAGREVWSAQEVLEHLRARSAPKFFASFHDRAATLEALRVHWPNAQGEIVTKAERILAGRFDLLGLSDLSFGSPIDWQLEPIAQKRSPPRHWSRLDFLDAELAGDKKIVWELNRHQYFSTLGQAYWLTGDERYAQAFVSHLESWMDQNPPKLGINWASSLEVAFRSISWLWAFYFFKDSPALNSRVFIRALKFLYLNARHLETYLSTYFSPNTHLTGEALGLFYLGLLLPEFKEAARWRETGKSILLAQLAVHVRPDGVYFEQSSYYHRYTVDFYTHFLILAHASSDPLPREIEEKLQALLDHLMYITRPDGTTPFFGDDDGGRLLMLDHRPANDFRAALSTGAALFKRGDYKLVAGSPAEETLWLLGSGAVQQLEQLAASEPAQQSVAFDEGGYYVMRDGWSNTANYLLFDCGPHGQANCGHAHSDALAIELAANGRTLLVDPGTYTYTGSAELRDWFRGSSAHNTLTIDGRSASIPAGPFSWKTIAQCKLLTWLSHERFDFIAGTQDGYESGPDAASHNRSILFLKQDYWIMRDQIASAGEHPIDLWFHFEATAAPLIESATGEETSIAELSGQSGLDLQTFAKNGRWRREEGWVSHCYAEKSPSRVYVFSAQMKQASLLTFMLPRTAEKRWRVREIEAVGGRAFELTNENWVDIVMICTEARVETARMASDFEWTWTRFSARDDNTLPEQMVLLRGSSLNLEGRPLLQLKETAEYVVGSRTEEGFRFESNEGSLDRSMDAREETSTQRAQREDAK